MQDFAGYMVELSGNENGKDKIFGCIAVDVSSDPARFPRNGFLSEYGQMTSGEINNVMSYLNRLHMNWIQFQDWEFITNALSGSPAFIALMKGLKVEDKSTSVPL